MAKYSSELLLIIASIVWGFAFVAQKAGMDDLGPMAYNGLRFILGAITLLPILVFTKIGETSQNNKLNKIPWKAGIISGSVLFLASSAQQFGIVFTTAGNAGFITSIYVILVPIIGLLFHHKVNIQTWIGASIAIVGLYLLSASEGLQIAKGDLLVLGSAFVWAIQVLLASYYSIRVHVIKLAIIQFSLTGILSLLISFFTEDFGLINIYEARLPIIYGGIMSVGLAFTLQLVAQKKANPTHAAIILSTESVFAALGGWLILNERLSTIEIMGALLMLTGIILSQLKKQ